MLCFDECSFEQRYDVQIYVCCGVPSGANGCSSQVLMTSMVGELVLWQLLLLCLQPESFGWRCFCSGEHRYDPWVPLPAQGNIAMGQTQFLPASCCPNAQGPVFVREDIPT